MTREINKPQKKKKSRVTTRNSRDFRGISSIKIRRFSGEIFQLWGLFRDFLVVALLYSDDY